MPRHLLIEVPRAAGDLSYPFHNTIAQRLRPVFHSNRCIWHRLAPVGPLRSDRAELNAEDRLLDLLMPPQPEPSESAERSREKLRERLREGKLDERLVEIEVKDRAPSFEISTNTGIEEMGINIKDMLPNLFGQKTRRRKMRVAEGLDYLVQEEEQKLIDMDQVTRVALERVESSGIIFLDEIDKIAGRESGHGPDVSREGVQRDILPIVEGATVNTRYGMDFIRILKEPKNALAKQYTALLETEGIKLILTDDALAEVAKFAAQVNESSENIGARRLHTIMEKMLEEVSFEGPDLKKKTVRVDTAYVRKQLADIVKDQDL